MPRKTYSCRSGTARASPWRRVLNALTIAALGALLMFVAAAVAHATGSPHRAVVSHGAAIATDLTASLDAPAFSASAADCHTGHARRSTPQLHSNGDGSSPFPDVAEDDRDDDDDDDDLHRAHAAAPSRLNAQPPLDQHSCPLLEGALSDHQTPSEFLTDSVRRM